MECWKQVNITQKRIRHKLENGNYVVKYKDADYSKVEEAAIDGVVYGKDITEQETVDAYAKAINDAIAGLEKVEKKDTKNEEEVKKPATGDNVIVYAVIFVVALAGVVIAIRKRE